MLFWKDLPDQVRIGKIRLHGGMVVAVVHGLEPAIESAVGIIRSREGSVAGAAVANLFME